ncbi:MAG: hypothetical protein ACI3Y9_01380 [Candidatus Cryptobacteroides sp.]
MESSKQKPPLAGKGGKKLKKPVKKFKILPNVQAEKATLWFFQKEQHNFAVEKKRNRNDTVQQKYEVKRPASNSDLYLSFVSRGRSGCHLANYHPAGLLFL